MSVVPGKVLKQAPGAPAQGQAPLLIPPHDQVT